MLINLPLFLCFFSGQLAQATFRGWQSRGHNNPNLLSFRNEAEAETIIRQLANLTSNSKDKTEPNKHFTTVGKAIETLIQVGDLWRASTLMKTSDYCNHIDEFETMGKYTNCEDKKYWLKICVACEGKLGKNIQKLCTLNDKCSYSEGEEVEEDTKMEASETEVESEKEAEKNDGEAKIPETKAEVEEKVETPIESKQEKMDRHDELGSSSERVYFDDAIKTLGHKFKMVRTKAIFFILKHKDSLKDSDLKLIVAHLRQLVKDKKTNDALFLLNFPRNHEEWDKKLPDTQETFCTILEDTGANMQLDMTLDTYDQTDSSTKSDYKLVCNACTRRLNKNLKEICDQVEQNWKNSPSRKKASTKQTVSEQGESITERGHRQRSSQKMGHHDGISPTNERANIDKAIETLGKVNEAQLLRRKAVEALIKHEEYLEGRHLERISAQLRNLINNKKAREVAELLNHPRDSRRLHLKLLDTEKTFCTILEDKGADIKLDMTLDTYGRTNSPIELDYKFICNACTRRLNKNMQDICDKVEENWKNSPGWKKAPIKQKVSGQRESISEREYRQRSLQKMGHHGMISPSNERARIDKALQELAQKDQYRRLKAVATLMELEGTLKDSDLKIIVGRLKLIMKNPDQENKVAELLHYPRSRNQMWSKALDTEETFCILLESKGANMELGMTYQRVTNFRNDYNLICNACPLRLSKELKVICKEVEEYGRPRNRTYGWR